MRSSLLTLAVATAIAVIPVTVSAPAASAADSETSTEMAAPVQQPSATVNVPASIAADCSVDVTTALNNWIATVPDDSKLLFRGDGCYRLDYTLWLTDRHVLRIDGGTGAGARFQAKTTFPLTPKVSRPMITVLGGSDITIENITLIGTNNSTGFTQGREWFHGLNIKGVQGALIENVDGKNIWGDFIHLAEDGRGQGPVIHANGVTVTKSSSTWAGRAHIACTACENVLVTDSTFMSTGYQVFNIEVGAPDWHASDVAFTNNTIGGTISLSVLVNAGVGDYVRHITFSGNTMTSAPISCHAPIYILDTEPDKSDFVVKNNQLVTLGAAARIAGVSNFSMTDNTVQMVWGGQCPQPGTALRAGANTTGTVIHNTFLSFERVLPVGVPAPKEVCGNRLGGSAYNAPNPC